MAKIKQNKNAVPGATFTLGNYGGTHKFPGWSAIPAWGYGVAQRTPDDTLTGVFSVENNNVKLKILSYGGSFNHNKGDAFPGRCAGSKSDFRWGNRGAWPDYVTHLFDMNPLYTSDGHHASCYHEFGYEFNLGDINSFQSERIQYPTYWEIITYYYLGMTGYYSGDPSPYYPVFPIPARVGFSSAYIPRYYYPMAINEKGSIRHEFKISGSNCTIVDKDGNELEYLTLVEAGDIFKFKVIPTEGYALDKVTDTYGNEYKPDDSGYISIISNKDYTLTAQTSEIKTACAVYSSANKYLAFYYDNRDHSKEGQVYSIPATSQEIKWGEHGSEIENIFFDTSFLDYNLTNAAQWFGTTEYPNVSEINMACFPSKNVKDMSLFFTGLINVKTISFEDFDTSSLTNIDRLFDNCQNLEKIISNTELDFSHIEEEFVFTRCSNKLKGDQGTTWSEDKVSSAYAHMDKGTSNPGYFSVEVIETKMKGAIKFKDLDKDTQKEVLNLIAFKEKYKKQKNLASDFVPCDNEGHAVELCIDDKKTYRSVKNSYGANENDQGLIMSDKGWTKQQRG